MRARRRRAIALIIAAAFTVLSACSAALPTPIASGQAVPPPVLSATQVQTVLGAVDAVLAPADKALDPTTLPTRLTGPALAMRSAEYVRAKVTGGAKPPTELPANEASAVIPQSQTWPRTVLVITDQPEDLGPRRVLVLQQTAPREQYKLWGWARMFPGDFPQTAALTAGSAVLANDDPDLLVKPDELLAQYADVLDKGAGSAAAGSFADDPFRTLTQTTRSQQQDLAVQGGATFTESYSPVGGPLVALATQQGGAIVVGQMTTTSTVTAATGGTVGNDPVAAALAGATPTSSLSRTYTDVLIFYVPPKAAGGQVVALAAEQIVTAAAVS
jgi:hypothetical protein